MRPSPKDSILDAAENVVTHAGAAHLTLDAVAEQAGVSKGGLLYHFPSKESLLQGMLTRLLERFEQEKNTIRSQLPTTPSSTLQSHILASFACVNRNKRVNAAILAAGANDPRLLDPVRQHIRNAVASLEGDLNSIARSVIVLLAADGLWLNELLETMPLNDELRSAVRDQLLLLAESAAA